MKKIIFNTILILLTISSGVFSQTQVVINSGISSGITAGTCVTIKGSLQNNGLVDLQSVSGGDASLIVDGTISGSGTYNVDRYIEQNVWHLVSPPITNATAGVFVDMWLRPYDESINDFGEYIVPTATALTSGIGYSVYTYNSAARTFTGNITNASVNLTLQRSADGGQPLTRGWNLIGNPYTSAIDLEAASGWTVNDAQIASAVYVWNQTQYSVSLAGFGSNIGVSVNNPSRYLAMGQGFFVQARTNGATIGMNKNIQVHNGVAFRDSEIIPNLISIKVEGNGHADETVIYQNYATTDDYDFTYDAAKLYGINEAPQLYTKKQENMLAIHSVNDAELINGMGVHLEVGADTEYALLFTHSFNSGELFLHDMFTNQVIQAGQEYTFTVQADDNAERFRIGYITTGINSELSSTIKIWEYNNELHVAIPDSETLEFVTVYSVLGKTLLQTQTTYCNLSALPKGMYVVKVKTNKQTAIEKIMIE
jgi:trimeric autotransporter adhesin